eukprot:TRINITY_DN13688_c0_g1_i1.p1 TRINITY_DN13688_c0_g1~~TRINITY_DN13688_c0_g1_i1.p1  ORF type:complete len:496 (-),score=77.76 TRINITY_DN13688_c0_g1_i1:248-1735(-)
MVFSNLSLLIIAAVVLALIFVFLSKRQARLFPGPDPAPLVGNVLQLNPAKLHERFESWAQEYGKLYELWFFNTRTIVVTDPEVAKKILFARPDAYTRIDILRKALDEIGALGLFGLEGETWKRHRRLIMPAFAKGNVNRMHYCIEIPVGRLVEKWRRQVEEAPDGSYTIVQPRQEMARLTLDVVTYLTCGIDLNSVQKGETSLSLQLAEFFASLNDRVVPSLKFALKRTLVPGWDRDFQKTKANVTKVINEIIESTKQQLADEKAGKIEAGKSNLLREMIRASLEGDSFTDDELRHEILTIMLAGYDTTSILLSWSLVMLCLHPEWQKTLRDEVLGVVGETALPSPDQLSKLTRTNYFLQETLRVQGPAPFNTAQNLEAVTINGVEIETGANFFFLGRAMVNQLFDDPAAFRPERWSDPKLTTDSMATFTALLPFGGGTRVCPGRQLALSEATTALAALIRSFEFELIGPAPTSELVFVAMPTPFQIKIKAAKQN